VHSYINIFTFGSKNKSKLLEFLSLDGTNCTANKIFEAFNTFFKKRNIPLKNIVAMANDNHD